VRWRRGADRADGGGPGGPGRRSQGPGLTP
jgi:hypothetical protein